MTETVKYIVSCLNSTPFDMGLRLIDFHEMQRHELLQILLDVLSSIDSKLKSSVAYYFDNGRSGVNEILSFLSVIRYKNMPTIQDEDEIYSWIDRLCAGDKQVVYPILEFCFSQLELVKKRVYLSPFLTPIQLPLDLTMTQSDDTLVNLANRYQSLQEEFKHVHMLYDDARNEGRKGTSGEVSLIAEINTLKQEKAQLVNEVKALNQKSKHDETFLSILETITALRQGEEKEIYLRDRIKDQNHSLEIAKGKQKEMQRQLSSLKSVTSSPTGGSPEGILYEIKKQLVEIKMSVRSDLMSQRSALQEKIDDIEGFRKNRKYHSEDELEDIHEKFTELEDEYNSKLKLLEEYKSKKSYSKILIYQQHVNAARNKVKSKDSVVRMKKHQLDALKEENDTKMANDSEKHITMNTSSFDIQQNMTLQQKVEERNKIERLVSELRHGSVFLTKTEEILKSRQSKIIKEEEQNTNAKGFHYAQKALKETVENVNKVDEMKGRTLEEISGMVTKITEKLKNERQRLQPMIQELKKVREEHEKIQVVYHSSKNRYEKMASRLAADRQPLEKECDILQKEWLQEERNYHYITNANEIVKANLYKVQLEEGWQNGKENMLPDFKCLHDLYRNKIVQQENLAKQLRIEQKDLTENESENVKQRKLFTSLIRILKLKMKLKNDKKMLLPSASSSIADPIRAIEELSF